METGDLKALLSPLLLPPAGPLLLALFGWWLAGVTRWFGRFVVFAALASLWALSSGAVSVWLARTILPLPPATTLVDVRRARVQAVVVLGGGVLPQAPEYGVPQPSSHSLSRLRYGVRLARQAGVPLAFTGGRGGSGNGQASGAEAARLAARQDFGFDLRWAEDQSRDTRENALRTAQLLQREGIRRVALVSDAWHLPRATREFEQAGFEVLPAPTGLPSTTERPVLEWVPSANALVLSRNVLREWIALRAQALRTP